MSNFWKKFASCRAEPCSKKTKFCFPNIKRTAILLQFRRSLLFIIVALAGQASLLLAHKSNTKCADVYQSIYFSMIFTASASVSMFITSRSGISTSNSSSIVVARLTRSNELRPKSEIITVVSFIIKFSFPV